MIKEKNSSKNGTEMLNKRHSNKKILECRKPGEREKWKDNAWIVYEGLLEKIKNENFFLNGQGSPLFEHSSHILPLYFEQMTRCG